MASIAGSISAGQRGRMPGWPWLAGGLAIVVIGFWPTFFGDPLSNDAIHSLHGIVSTLWVVLLVAQSLLIGRGAHRLHRRLGWASLGLVALLLGTSAQMVRLEIISPEPFPAPLRLTLIWLDVLLLGFFTALYAAGLSVRRRRALHLRLMASTLLVGMDPALGRFFAINFNGIGGLAGALEPSFRVIDLILVAAILIDWRRGRLVWPYPVALATWLAIEASLPLAHTPTFVSFVRALGAPV